MSSAKARLAKRFNAAQRQLIWFAAESKRLEGNQEMGSKLVIVVDDDPFMREVARVHLEGVGYSVELAACGEEGVAKTIALQPAAVILDFAMPDISGAETLKRIREHPSTARTPVLVLTAWSSDEDALEVRRLGAEWLQKPLRPELLIEALRVAMG